MEPERQQPAVTRIDLHGFHTIHSKCQYAAMEDMLHKRGKRKNKSFDPFNMCISLPIPITICAFKVPILTFLEDENYHQCCRRLKLSLFKALDVYGSINNPEADLLGSCLRLATCLWPPTSKLHHPFLVVFLGLHPSSVSLHLP